MAANSRDRSSLPPAPQPGPQRSSDWAPLIVALVVPILLLQVAVVRPTSTQLSRMRGQVARLEATIEKLQDREASTQRATGLLVELQEQESRIAGAEAALDRFARLETRLDRSLEEANRAADSLDRLDALVQRVDQQSQLLDDAEQALHMLADVPSELHGAIDRAGRIAPAIGRVQRLALRLGQARDLADLSLVRVEDLVTTQQALSVGTDRIDSANRTLDGLVRLESRLNAPLMAVGASHERLDALVRLKDSVLTQTEDLPEAFDTFELIVGLQGDYRRARGVFQTLQRLMADLVLLEPAIGRIAAVVEPMIDRTSIATLGGTELRMVLREMRLRRAETLAELEANEPSVADRSEITIK